jgi:acyl-coenzyme A thioesterase 1/2/4
MPSTDRHVTMPLLSATPSEALQPTAIQVTATGFAAGERVTLASRLVDDAGVEWTAHGVFVADAAGRIDLRDAPSEAGTFTGVDPAGLFWSLRPQPVADRSFMIKATQKAHKLGQPHVDPVKPLRIELTATAEGGSTANCVVTLTRLADGIDVVPLRDGRLRGMVFRWRDRTKPRGAIMSLTGSGGGVEWGYAPLLASLGYDVVSLAYFAYEDLPPAVVSIPLEYFEEGFAWMRRELGATKIAVQGASRGGELTLVLAAHLPNDVAGAIAIVPMFVAAAGWDPEKGVSGSSWTYRGQDIPFAPPAPTPSIEEFRRRGELEPNGYACTPEAKEEVDHPEVRENLAIPVERARGPVLLISGVDDQMWPSAWGSDIVVNRLRAKGFAFQFEHLCLPETGHITPLPNTVTTFCPALFHSLLNIFLACGGTPAGTARASRMTWDAIKVHYERVFGPTAPAQGRG